MLLKHYATVYFIFTHKFLLQGFFQFVLCAVQSDIRQFFLLDLFFKSTTEQVIMGLGVHFWVSSSNLWNKKLNLQSTRNPPSILLSYVRDNKEQQYVETTYLLVNTLCGTKLICYNNTTMTKSKSLGRNIILVIQSKRIN